ncbi:DUF5701 family protein [Sporichthya sp.]|uniref:DUF5701 family protein n=1 Tax=Sporichthya sp. TaxID=65475 RepID=UPI001834906C|nr:DUF5701 family protein [Sporichthya sp.]MBA3743644.1 hypothetical protein [Sporichthya sp.]
MTVHMRVDVTVGAGPLDVPGVLAAVTRDGKPGFVSADLADWDRFVPIAGLEVPTAAYRLVGVERGEEYLNWSPDEALPAIHERGRTPLTVAEGVALLAQHPDLLEPNKCFMLVGSRCGDRRVPALWISGGTGKDGRDRKGAAKLGWCWAGNRHTWLGHASAAARVPSTPGDPS